MICILKYRSSCKYLWFAGLSTVMRPTAFVTWLPLYVWHLSKDSNVFNLVKNTCLIG